MDVRKYITEESINNESYYCSDAMKKQIVYEIVNIIRDDEKFQEFVKTNNEENNFRKIKGYTY